jgi:hypothetical protein
LKKYFCFLFSIFSTCLYAHNYNVAELKQSLNKAYSALGSDVELPNQITSQIKEIFGGLKGDLFEVHFNKNLKKEISQADVAGWVFLFEQEETPHLVSVSKNEKKVKAFLVGKNFISEAEYKDYSFLEKVNSEMLRRLTPQVMREHDHSSMHGGTVLMFIDDHVEISRSSDKKIFAYVSDKKRQRLPLSEFEKISFTLVSGKKTQLLRSEKMKHGSMEMMLFFLPEKAQDDAVLNVLLKRKKGNAVTRFTRLSLVPVVDTKGAMSEHLISKEVEK